MIDDHPGQQGKQSIIACKRLLLLFLRSLFFLLLPFSVFLPLRGQPSLDQLLCAPPCMQRKTEYKETDREGSKVAG
jgi:hypothetical protein